MNNSHQRKMMIISAPCWQCDKEMLIALIGDDNGNMDYGPEKFSQKEIELAEKNGVLIKKVTSKIADETYLANTCSGCGTFVGQWFYFANYYSEALYGRLKYQRV
jgi:hypothetical protein